MKYTDVRNYLNTPGPGIFPYSVVKLYFKIFFFSDDFKPDFFLNPGSGSNPGSAENYSGFSGSSEEPNGKCP